MLFNPEESINFQGHTGPFIQYTHARIVALGRKAQEQNLTGGDFSTVTALHETEAELIQHLAAYPAAVAEAARQLAPSVIGQYAYDLAKAFNRFYAEVPVLAEEDTARRALRLALTQRVGEQLRVSMSLLGIKVPERM